MSVVSIDRRSSNTLSICNKKEFRAFIKLSPVTHCHRDCYISLQVVYQDIRMANLTFLVKRTILHTNSGEEPSKHYFSPFSDDIEKIMIDIQRVMRV